MTIARAERQMEKETLLEVQDLKMHFPLREGLLNRASGYVYAVDGVSLEVRSGETLGLVGESGCGKTTVGRCILGLYRPTSGKIFFEGREIHAMSREELAGLRSKAQMIFQDPYSSLNPRMRVRDIIGEVLKVHKLAAPGDRTEKVAELLNSVGLQAEHGARYPHEFSGGQRQRIGIARALAMNPELIIADEPVSALDVSIQAQVINLLDRLKEQFGLSYLVIAHDLSVVEHIADRIAVMYLGRIAEVAGDKELYTDPKHPYTQALIAAVPKAEVGGRERRESRKLLTGEVPSPIDPPSGCLFHTRCPHVMDICRREAPPAVELSPRHSVSCFLYA
jgi:oligopeptide/dipeptide ABC transporter ATP-binding protein